MSIARQIDKICDEFEASFRAGRPQKLSDVLETSPQELRAELLLRLIEVEVELRLANGQAVAAKDYAAFDDTAVRHAAKVKRRLTENHPFDLPKQSPNEAMKIYAVQAPSATSDGQDSTAASDDTKKGLPTIGPYQLLKVIGKGGMGIVYVADQMYPIKRTVALKLIRAGMGGREVLSRFEAERQALTLMNDQNIARVLDAGTTSAGRPFFVMEFIEGITITRYCDRSNLDLNGRLKLFLQSCSAIQHAHQKGILHRDIKPSNILVTHHNGAPLVKVIDFGLAKALDASAQLITTTLQTATGDLLGTPLYMSPEQVERDALDIDTRTDVYSLGVLLYELLTGTTPVDKKMVLEDVLRAIREEEPPRPSLRLNLFAYSTPKLTDERRTEIRRLSDSLKGDLDWIVMKSLEKDRARRFESVTAFAEDVERYLAGDAITARPPSAKYKLQKYIGKNRGLVASAISLVLLLVLGIVGTSWGMYRASVETGLAQQANEATEKKAEEARKASELAEFEAKQARAAQQLAEIAEQKAESEAASARKAEEKAEHEVELADAEREKTQRAINKQEAILARSNYFLANARWKENRVADAIDLLLRIPLKHRNLEWYIDWRLYQGSRKTLHGHTEDVWSVAFNQDGNRIVSGSADTTLKLWDAASGEELMTFVGHNNVATGVDFSPDGAQIVSGSADNTLKLWDVATGTALHTLRGHTEAVSSVAFSPDGMRIVSGSDDESLKLWDAATGKQLRTFTGHTAAVSSVAFSPDGSKIVSGSFDCLLKLWDAEMTEVPRTIGLHDGLVLSVAFSSDGHRIVSGGSDSSIRLWDTLTGEIVKTFEGHVDHVHSVVFNPDGNRILSASADGKLILWDTETAEELRTLVSHGDRVNCVACSPDGSRIVWGSGDIALNMIEAATAEELLIANRIFDWLDDEVSSVMFSPDGNRVVSGSKDGTLKVWDVVTGERILSLEGHDDSVLEAKFSPDGNLIVSGSWDTTLRIWDATTGRNTKTLFSENSQVTCIALQPDSKAIVSGNFDRSLRLWNIATGKKTRMFIGHTEPILSVAFSSDGSRIVSSSSDRTLKLWDVATGHQLLTFTGHTEAVRSVAFSPDGNTIASGCDDHSLKLWDAETGKELQTLRGHTFGVTGVAFNSDGSRLVSGSGDKSVKIWDVATGKSLGTLHGHKATVTSVNVSPDGNAIVSGSLDRTIKLWNATTGKELMTFNRKP